VGAFSFAIEFETTRYIMPIENSGTGGIHVYRTTRAGLAIGTLVGVLPMALSLGAVTLTLGPFLPGAERSMLVFSVIITTAYAISIFRKGGPKGLELVVSDNVLKLTCRGAVPHYLVRDEIVVALDSNLSVSLIHGNLQTQVSAIFENWDDLRGRLLRLSHRVERRSLVAAVWWTFVPSISIALSLVAWTSEPNVALVASLVTVVIAGAGILRVWRMEYLSTPLRVAGAVRALIFALAALARLVKLLGDVQ
jgi:hypothetical protein